MNVKKMIILVFALAAFVARAQTKSDIFRAEVPVTWLGLDFSATNLIGDREKYGSESDVHHLLDAWNDLILKEADKYNVAKAIGRSKVENNFQAVKARNAELDALAMLTEDAAAYVHLKTSDIDEIVASYDLSGLSGLGLMFNVESFNKKNEEGSIYITFIKLDSKEVLFTERITAPPGGAGLRNFWAGCVAKVIAKLSSKNGFESWRKRYYKP
jgi:hypothetical protein